MRSRTTCWVKKGRTSAWWDKFLNNKVMDSDWLENFRMFKTSFGELVNILRLYLEKQVTRMRKPLSTERQIASFLYYVVMKPATVKQQMPMVYHMDRCHL